MRPRIVPSPVKRAEGAALRRSSSEASIWGSLTHNTTGSSIFGDLTRLRVPRARWSYRWFTDPRARAGYPVQDHATESRALVADLRAAAVRRDDAQAKDLVRRLLRSIPEIRGPVTSACGGGDAQQTQADPAPRHGPYGTRLPDTRRRGAHADPRTGAAFRPGCSPRRDRRCSSSSCAAATPTCPAGTG
ncbi:hypothetical protein [Streptomyces sp. RB17]|uniref:MmyB family transcriptional regulator n=1 Tax=Streptomyces sp. RB17 TaxID=2585197 RepID=UPI0018865A87